MAVRLAIGATRSRVARQLLPENLLLAALGGGLGLVLSIAGTNILLTIVDLDRSPRSPSASRQLDLDVPGDGRMMLFTASLSIVVALLCGMSPAFRGSRAPIGTLGRRIVDAGEGARSRPRKTLLVAQVAAAMLLVAGALVFRARSDNCGHRISDSIAAPSCWCGHFPD